MYHCSENLTSATFLGLIDDLNFDDLLKTLYDKEGATVSTDLSRWNLDTPGYSDIHKLWIDAKFNNNAIQWTNYYPVSHFESKIIDEVASYLKLQKVHRAWVSRIDPGYYAPWHWDVDDNEEEYAKEGPISRYTITLEPSKLGHILILGNDYLFNLPSNAIYKWNNHREWHAGINAGLNPTFMLHIVALSRA